jgi:hypothetical protein
MTDHVDDVHDALVGRLRERVADPDRRLDARPSEFYASVSSMGLGDLLSMGRSVAQDLRRLLNQGPDDELIAKADAFERQMAVPAVTPLPPSVTPGELEAAERRMGVTLPPLMRLLYLELANGGFGPGYGILGIEGGWTTDRGKTIEDLYAEMSDSQTEDSRWVWPAGLVPIVDHSGSFSCLDTTSTEGRIVEWDPGELHERGRDGGWSRSFREESPSLAGWLEAWLDRPTMAEQQAELWTSLRSGVPEEIRALWASMPEQRAAMGLPEKGWGRALFGEHWGDDPRDQG